MHRKTVARVLIFFFEIEEALFETTGRSRLRVFESLELIRDIISSFASRWSGSVFSGRVPNPRESKAPRNNSRARYSKSAVSLDRWIVPGMTSRRIHSRLAQGMRFDVDRDYFGCISTLATLWWSPVSSDTGGEREGRGEWALAGFVPVGGREARSSRNFVIAFSNGRSLSRCAPLSDREAAAARVSPLRSDVLVGVESAEAPEDGLRHGHLRDALLLPVLPVQIEDRSELPKALALGAQHQVDAAPGRRPYLVDRRPRCFRNCEVSAKATHPEWVLSAIGINAALTDRFVNLSQQSSRRLYTALHAADFSRIISWSDNIVRYAENVLP